MAPIPEESLAAHAPVNHPTLRPMFEDSAMAYGDEKHQGALTDHGHVLKHRATEGSSAYMMWARGLFQGEDYDITKARSDMTFFQTLMGAHKLKAELEKRHLTPIDRAKAHFRAGEESMRRLLLGGTVLAEKLSHLANKKADPNRLGGFDWESMDKPSTTSGRFAGVYHPDGKAPVNEGPDLHAYPRAQRGDRTISATPGTPVEIAPARIEGPPKRPALTGPSKGKPDRGDER